MSDLPKGWRPSTLGEVARVLDSRRIPLNARERDARRGPFPYYGANGQVGTIDDYLFEGDHILLAEDGGYFDDPNRTNAYAVGGKFWVNNHAHILQATEAVEQRFLLHLLNATDLMPYVNGTTRLKLTQADMRRIPVPLPPLAEQRRIVARIEALFARTRRAHSDLERISVLSVRNHRAILAREYEGEQAVPTVPTEEHQFVPLSECVTDFTYGTAVKCSHDVSGVPVLRIPNVAAGRISLDDMKFAALPEREYKKLALTDGDILIVRSNGSPELIGRPALVEQSAVGMAFAGYLIRARPRRDCVEPAYLLHMLSSPAVRRVVELNARSSSGVHNINATELAALRVPLPSLHAQKQAVRRIEQARAHARLWEADTMRSLALLDRLEQSVLARAFRGELVPQSHLDDPADASIAKPEAQATVAKVRARGRRGKELTALARGQSRRGIAMSKSRNDADVRGMPYLADCLRRIGPTSPAEDLYRAADLPIAEFYKQLSDEMSRGLIEDVGGKLEAV